MSAQILLFPSPPAGWQRSRQRHPDVSAMAESATFGDTDADLWALAEQLARVLGHQMHIALHEGDLAPCLGGGAHATNLDALVDWLYVQMAAPDVLPYVGSTQLQGLLRAHLERWFFELRDVQP